MTNEQSSKKVDVGNFRRRMKRIGKAIDSRTADILWAYAQTLDPYGLNLALPPELDQVGREYFARNRGGDVWVLFDDLPEKTRTVLRARARRGQFNAPLSRTELAEVMQSIRSLEQKGVVQRVIDKKGAERRKFTPTGQRSGLKISGASEA
jgi:hypothetical protein